MENELFNNGILPDDEELGYDDEEEELGIDYHEHSELHDKQLMPTEDIPDKVPVAKMPSKLKRFFPNVRQMGIELKSGKRVIFINED